MTNYIKYLFEKYKPDKVVVGLIIWVILCSFGIVNIVITGYTYGNDSLLIPMVEMFIILSSPIIVWIGVGCIKSVANSIDSYKKWQGKKEYEERIKKEKEEYLRLHPELIK